MARTDPTWASPLAETAARNAEMIARLVPVANALLLGAGGSGVTIADVRHTATSRGLLTGEEGALRQRAQAYLGAVMRAAGAVPKVCPCCHTIVTRRSTIERSHGNRHSVWVLPQFAE